jgi:hypothetical protein
VYLEILCRLRVRVFKKLVIATACDIGCIYLYTFNFFLSLIDIVIIIIFLTYIFIKYIKIIFFIIAQFKNKKNHLK